MKLTPTVRIAAGGTLSALLIVSIPVAVLLSVPSANASGTATRAAPASRHASVTLSPARVNMVIVPGIRLGPDKKMHDAFTPTDLTAFVGQKIIVTVYNYDTGAHSFTAPALNLNAIIAAAPRNGVPTIKTFSFTVKKAGSYHWLCALPCDSDAKGWAMSHDNYMAGTITIQR